MFGQALKMLGEAMQARTALRHRVQIVQGGPEHYVPLEAARMFMKLVEAQGTVGLVTL